MQVTQKEQTKPRKYSSKLLMEAKEDTTQRYKRMFLSFWLSFTSEST